MPFIDGYYHKFMLIPTYGSIVTKNNKIFLPDGISVPLGGKQIPDAH